MKKQSAKVVKAKDFDRMFDDVENLDAVVDFDNLTVHEPKKQMVNVDFPEWVVEALDEEAQRVGITRQAVIKLWITSKIDERRRA